MSEYNKALEIQRFQLAQSEDPRLDKPIVIEGINKLLMQNLVQAGFDTLRKVLLANISEIASVPGISLETAYKILEEASKR